MLGVQCSDSGAGGVFFCTEAKGSFVVKSTAHTAPEYFTNLLYKHLHVNVPAMRLIQWSTGEYATMMEEMKLCCYSEVKTKTKVRRELDRAYALVMEYIPGLQLMDIGPTRVQGCLSGPGHEALYQQIGKIAACDLLVNNSDRIPVVWENTGNANNLLFRLETTDLSLSQLRDPEYQLLRLSTVVAIDSRCYCIPQQDAISRRNYDSYIQRVNTYLTGLVNDLPNFLANPGQISIPAATPFLRFFRENGGGELKPAEVTEVLKGLMIGLREVAELKDEDLAAIFEHVATLVSQDWMNIWREELRLIGLPFLISIREVIAGHVEGVLKILSQFPDTAAI